MPKYKLTYFDFDGGRGEPVRIAFHAAGIQFEDHRISFKDFGEVRKTARFNALPVLEIDGTQVTQSNAMLRYLGKQGGLYPDDDTQALYCDEAMGAAEDLSHHIGQTIGLQGDELKEAREKLVAGRLPIFLRGMDDLLKRGGGRYFADKRLTVADLKVFVETRWLQSGSLDHIPKELVQELAPLLAEHEKRVAADPAVVAYYASRA
ncbi:MAG: glutathione S-transferase family protein [Gammaproteobacteria bacterium]|nr:glutathione S-transferase family protein [Gammaproteobacteria bacterium]